MKKPLKFFCPKFFAVNVIESETVTSLPGFAPKERTQFRNLNLIKLLISSWSAVFDLNKKNS